MRIWVGRQVEHQGGVIELTAANGLLIAAALALSLRQIRLLSHDATSTCVAAMAVLMVVVGECLKRVRGSEEESGVAVEIGNVGGGGFKRGPGARRCTSLIKKRQLHFGGGRAD
jgi:hypothetical protein